MNKRFRLLLLAIVLLPALVACGEAPVPTPTPIFALPAQGILILPTDSAITAPTDAAATPDATLPPAIGAARTLTPAPPLAAGKISVKIFLIAMDDNGKSGKKIGCNDSLVAVDRTIPETLGVLTAALNELFSMHEKNVGASGLYNALYQSTLKLDGAAVINGRASIALSGKLVRGGVCDDPRVKYQIEETALQFATVKSVAVTINGIALEKVLSEK